MFNSITLNHALKEVISACRHLVKVNKIQYQRNSKNTHESNSVFPSVKLIGELQILPVKQIKTGTDPEILSNI